MAKLILIEGIPGSGKTTFSGKVKEYYEGKNHKVQLFREGELHPADLAWHAVVDKKEMTAFIEENPELKDRIHQFSTTGDENYFVAYTQLNIPPENKSQIKFFETREVYGGGVTLNRFCSSHMERWHAFLEGDFEEDDVFIFECSYLQNHITELILTFDESKEMIEEHLSNLLDVDSELDIHLIYLNSVNVDEAIARVTKERVSPDKSRWPDWIDIVVDYVENSLYGKKHELSGYDGFIDFIKLRKATEYEVMSKLSINVNEIRNESFEWDQVWHEIMQTL